jgi:hypothetical protein
MPRGDCFNRGEWAELYVFLHILGTGKLECANASMKPSGSSFDVYIVTREDIVRFPIQYIIAGGSVRVMGGGGLYGTFPQGDFWKYALMLKREVIGNSGRSFPISNALWDFLEKIQVRTPKSRSVGATIGVLSSGGKTDITIQFSKLYPNIGSVEKGFSIKAMIGSASTLFNPSANSSFRFRLDGMTYALSQDINSTMDTHGNIAIKARMEKIRDAHIHAVLLGTVPDPATGTEVFKTTLATSSDYFPTLGKMISLSFFDPSYPTKVKDLSNLMVTKFPLPAHNESTYYPTVIKRFLLDAFTWLTSSSSTTSATHVNGGYIVVNKDWEVLAYPLADASDFEQYLFDNTFLDRPSASRYNYASVMHDPAGFYYIDLCLQVRFINA